MRLLIALCLLIVLTPGAVLHAQDTEEFDPTGAWTGAFIMDGSVLPIYLLIE